MVNGPHSRNDRLAEAMSRMQVSSAQAAEAAEVDPRTVDRWVDDAERIPRPHSREALSALLEVPAGVLWPSVENGQHVTDELRALYPQRTAIPGSHVMALLSAAERQVDLLAYAAMWLWDAVPDFGETLRQKAESGVQVRVCLGDPACSAVRVRGEEEGIGSLLASRCQLALAYARQWITGAPGAVRLHGTTLYASIFRFDDAVLLNWHLYGSPAGNSPVLHLERRGDRGVAAASIESLDRVWDRAQPANE